MFRKLSLSALLIAGCVLAVLAANRTAHVTQAQAVTPLPTGSSTIVNVNLTPVSNNPILSPGKTGQWDSVSVRFPQIVVYKGIYYLFYSTFQSMTDPVGIGYATSTDGLQWSKFDGNPILSGSGSGFDSFGVTRPVVIVEPDGTWVMYYDGLPAPNNVFGPGIGRATAPSPSGPWTRAKDPVLQAGTNGEWDARFLFPDSVVADGNQYVMYYSAGRRVGRATSTDGIQWTKYKVSGSAAKSDPVLPLGDPGSWDTILAWSTSVQHTSNGWEMFYSGGNDPTGKSTVKIGYAYSADGITWIKAPANPVIVVADHEAFFPSFIVNSDATYSVYYSVSPGDAYTEFHLSTGTVTHSGS